MAHFAQIDANGIVTNVIVVADSDTADSDGNEVEAIGIAFCKSLLGSDTNWVQTSYNDNIRYRYASIGIKYDSTNDVFYGQQPYPSWTLNTSTWVWEAPVALLDDADADDVNNPIQLIGYAWDEDNLAWVKTTTSL